MTASTNLQALVRRGLAWSALNSLVLRVGNFLVGIFLARILVPEVFGVFAVALTVQTILMTLADLGMSADLIRSDNPREKAPTVATLALISGAGLSTVMMTSAQGIADLLGSRQAGPVIAVSALSLVLAGAGVAPYAALQREFAQKKVFIIAVVEFLVGTATTLILVSAGWGVMGLAIARLAAQLVTLILQFRLSGERLRLGYNRKLAPGIIKFGLPIAGANVLSWMLLNVDNIAISRLAGPISLGYYYLAFNISNWPMSALGQVVRSVSIPTFSRIASGKNDRSLASVIGSVWAAALLIGMMLAVLANPVVELIYGSRWLPSAYILTWLGCFGALRTLFDLAAGYLVARGGGNSIFFVQLAWLGTLIPATIIGAWTGQAVGVAVAHLAVALVVVCPSYAVALRANGADVRAVAIKLWPPLAAGLPALIVTGWVVSLAMPPLATLLLGGGAGASIYILLLRRWVRRQLSELAAFLPVVDSSAPDSGDSRTATTFDRRDG